MMKIVMKYYFIEEVVTGALNDAQHQKNAHKNNSPIDCDRAQLTNVKCYLYPCYDIDNTDL